ncbi:hypothetical protein [Brevibacterium sp. 2SA]|uniref:hypothetical protein n=1 Tax=Brevibacterium sp. 2SA TaxID=2502198 RepID=UPI0010F92B70|nr:hypothetical protein [Brevibacterium sp. 2SA]
MIRALTDLERDTALLLIRRGHTSPSAEDYAEFTPEQKEAWDPPTPITDTQRALWEANLAEVVVTSECGCETCPSVDLEPVGDAIARSDDALILNGYVPDALLLLFIDEGVPSYLELAPLDESVVYTQFPPAERIDF